jgi:transposase
MLRMDQVHVIRHKVLVEGRSIRSVARQMSVGRNTIKKYLTLSEPVRVVRQEKRSPVKELVAPRIDEIIEQWRGRTTAKQRITSTRIHRQLVEEGYQVGITTVRDYLREKRRQQAEVFIPLIHRPADEAQVDFFEVTVEEGGHRRKVWKFVMRLMYSGKDFVWLYERCDQLSLLDAHVRAFSYLGGVPRRIVYDNLAAAVKKVIGTERELTERFAALASHYLFEACFARPREGHDKGGVEARGKGIRLAHLTPIPKGETLSEISEVLLREVERSFAADAAQEELFIEEHTHLRELPDRPYEARKVELVSVSRRSTVRIEGATYSVPSQWASLRATAYVGVEDVKLVCRGQTETYPKERKGAKKIRYRHYLAEFARKPQAVRQVAPELIGELGEPYGKLWEMLDERYGAKEASRVLARILGAVVDHGEEIVAEALEVALCRGRCDLLSLAKHLDGRSKQLRSVAVPETLSGYQVECANVTDYDELLLGSVRAEEAS